MINLWKLAGVFYRINFDSIILRGFYFKSFLYSNTSNKEKGNSFEKKKLNSYCSIIQKFRPFAEVEGKRTEKMYNLYLRLLTYFLQVCVNIHITCLQDIQGRWPVVAGSREPRLLYCGAPDWDGPDQD